MAIQKNFAPIPENTLILGADKYFCMDGRVTHVNNNVLVVGRSGSGKTRYLVKPNLLQCNGSYVISDPKGMLRKEFESYFKAQGYKVLSMDFIHPEKSTHYNPISKIHNTNDIKKLVHAIVYAEASKGRRMEDPYWDLMTASLLMGIIGYMFETNDIPKTKRNMSMLEELLYKCNREKNANTGRAGERNVSKMTKIMENHNYVMQKRGKESWAYKQFMKVDSAPDKTYQTIISTAFSKISIFDSEEISMLLSKDGFDFKVIGQKPTVLFVEVSDTDRSTDILVNLFYTQLMNELCTYADDKCKNGCLPVPVQFILDDFATNCRIDGFENMISNIRSRGISTMLMVQSESQLVAGYGESAQTIIDNCSSYLYLGGTNFQSAEMAARRSNRPVHEILNMPIDSCWLFRIGEKPAMVDFVDIDAFQAQKKFVPFVGLDDTREGLAM